MNFEIDLKPTPEQIAEAFCNMDEFEQAKFFIECAKIGKTWNTIPGASWQWYRIGIQLKYSTNKAVEAREMIDTIKEGIDSQSTSDQIDLMDWKTLPQEYKDRILGVFESLQKQYSNSAPSMPNEAAQKDLASLGDAYAAVIKLLKEQV